VVEISEVKRSDKNTALDFLALPFLAMKKGRYTLIFTNFELISIDKIIHKP
jgi:hypothetical protein